MRIYKSIKGIMHQLSFILTQNQKKVGILMILMIIIGSLFETLGVSAILPFIESLTNPDDVVDKWYVIILMRVFHLQSYMSIVIGLAICIIVIYIVKNIYLYLSQIAQTYYRSKVQKKLSVQMLRTYLNQSYEEYVDMNTAQMIRGISEDVAGVYNIMDNMFRVLGEAFTVLLISAYLIYTDYIMAFAIIAIALVCFFTLIYGLKKEMTRLGISNREIRTTRYNSAYQAITGFKEIKVSRRTEKFIVKYEKEYEAQRKIEMQNEVLSNIPERLIEMLCVAALIGSVCIRVQIGADITSFIAKLAVFAVAAFRLLPSVSRLVRYSNGILYSKASLTAIYEQFSNIEEKNTKNNVDGSSKKVLTFNDELEVKNVNWKYKDSDKIILDHVDLTVKKGDAIAIVGESGAGKSTLADILLGLLEPENGKVLVDGNDIFSDLDSWSNIIGFVPQNIYMLDDTIRNNIVFGERTENVNDNEIWEVLQKVKLKEFVEALPQKLDTQAGERGMKISGGQRQRLAIARALYRNPQILILDEATSALDNDTEKAVMESIDSLHGEKTLIIIAHRITTIRNCNKIYEIKNGKIKEIKYEDLL